jgi:uncharacterized protein DUF1573
MRGRYVGLQKIIMRIEKLAILFVIALVSCTNRDARHGPLSNIAMLAQPIDSTHLTSIQWLDSTDRDFGKIPAGQKLEISYRFKNAGDQPLIIERVQPSCGCTVAEKPTEPITPGGEGVIKAAFNSESRVGVNHKTIYVYANTKGSRSQELKFEVIVEKKKW